MTGIGHREVDANGIQFALLEAGSGPLALCLHGFPDTAHTWRHLLPELADGGYRAVAPFMRGYSPTGLAPDGCYSLGALAADANALHDALDADQAAVLIGHDWGAEAAYGAAAFAPQRWSRLVTLAIPPLSMDPGLFSDYDQLKRFFYMYFFTQPGAEEAVAADDMAFLDRLWADWSPGYDAAQDLARVKESLREPENLAAAVAYYPASLGAAPESCSKFEAEQRAVAETAPQPTLYLHGARDGCIGADLVADAADRLSPESRFAVVDEVGHFLHLEDPARINGEILSWL
jgi:pimeloyl-ACP methyl ester carboxylesterase